MSEQIKKRVCRIGILLFAVSFHPVFGQDSFDSEAINQRSERSIQFQTELPERLDVIRERQAQVASAQNVRVVFNDLAYPRKSTSSMEGIPRDIQSRIINDQLDLNELVPDLYNLYGFQGTESLRFYSVGPGMNNDIRYYYREYINDIPTDHIVTITVDATTQKIRAMDGHLEIDQSFPSTASISQNHAIDLVKEFSVKNQQSSDELVISSTDLVYKGWGEDHSLTPWWQVTTYTGSVDNRDSYEYFLVAPDGTVSYADASREAPVRVCNGSAQINRYCSDSSNPIIINNGTCTTSPCPPSSSYQTPYDTAVRVQQMFNDVTGAAVNVGTANSDAGGAVDINVNGDTNGAQGVF